MQSLALLPGLGLGLDMAFEGWCLNAQASHRGHSQAGNECVFVEKERGQIDDLRGAVTVMVEREREKSFYLDCHTLHTKTAP